MRLEGGLGDHLLGMRVLGFIHQRLPEYEIVVYSESAFHPVPQEIVTWSPFVTRVIPVRSTPPSKDRVGNLENIHPNDLAQIFSADLFIEGWGGDMFTSASTVLRVPPFEILGSRPVLVVPREGELHADDLLKPYAGAALLGVHLGKGDPETISRFRERIEEVLSRLLEVPGVVVLNMFTSGYDFPHWPEPQRSARADAARRETAVLERLERISEQVVNCRDLPLATVAALLSRCKYFIGVDNGIKHLAWALDIPHTFFVNVPFRVLGTLRWMPDLHCILGFRCPPDEMDRHLALAEQALRQAAQIA